MSTKKSKTTEPAMTTDPLLAADLFPHVIPFERQKEFDQILQSSFLEFRKYENDMLAARLVSSISFYSPLCTIDTLMNYLPNVECKCKGANIQEYYYHQNEDNIHYLFKTEWEFINEGGTFKALLRFATNV
jgi:hypothetical protein